ncbi:MAG TPA: hypothetical protein VGZ51_05135, partial [Actinomycetota bacterium]|nr:hypothetical protein [Actinomycetota bacterium]
GEILEGGFVEGGINLSSIYEGLGKDLPCVNRFLAQTGSSHPDTGVLEDFAGGSFNVCSKLIVDKVTPSGDQTKFPFSVSGPNDYSDSFELASADAPHDSEQIKSGAYTVTETPGDPNIWNAPSVSCKDQGNSDVAYANGVVNIAPGATVTCTFTNSKRPQLTVIKNIVGGNGTTDSFDVKVDGAAKIDDATSTDPAGTSSGAFAVSAGAHAVTETLGDGSTPVSPSDWGVSFSGDCDSNGNVDVQNDESKTCTVTNSKLPKLTVIKQIEGGDGSSFDISVGQVKVLDDAGDGASDERTYAPGDYAVSETFGDGAAIGADWSVAFSGDCDANGSVSLAYGDAKTCTITNSKLPELVVIKQVVGGAKSPSDFQISVSGDNPSPSSFSGSADGTVVTLGPGGYDVSEVEDSHYAASYSADCKDGTIAYGESKTCTITNTRKPSSIMLDKVASPISVPEPGGDVTFTFRVHNTSPVDIVTIDSLADSVYGNLFLRGDCNTLASKQLAPDDGAAGGPDEATCSFSALVSGNAGDSHHNIGSVVGHDEDERPVTADDFADVEITDVAPSIDVTKTANPISVAEPGSTVEFTVDVENTSVSDPVTITSLVDDPDGAGPAEPIDLNGKGSCSVAQVIQPGDTYTCSFSRMITGNAGDVKIDV